VRVGILTAGGDAPGLNAVIRATATALMAAGHEAVGLRRGYLGLVEPQRRFTLQRSDLVGILQQGGTILSTSSFNPFRDENGLERVRTAQDADPLDGVIAVGGDHTMTMTGRLHAELGLPVVGVPKTIDNDVPGTDYTFGFDTAVQTVSDAIDRLRTTAQSHDRVMVVETMGRNTGWIAVFSGLASGADGIVIPELELTVEEMAQAINRRHTRGKSFSILVVAEGAELCFASGEKRQVRASEETDEYGYPRLGGIGTALAAELEARTGFETRVTALGHVQRGGSPSATDRILGTRYGLKAAELVMEGRFGEMAALHGTHMTSVPLSEVEGVKPVDLSYLDRARVFFG
jgi:ATP-dependent phosphofructokinase / diphosphate-dependent phosphofructokinase